jgi:hypothetical protein
MVFVRRKDKQAQMMVDELSKSRWYSNNIGIFNINCIISTGSCFIFTYLE